ncbi:ABC transporter substrate-binding protein [Lewinella sp. IMCC34183]|uniref:ABC transporter substrate-binding protein n=1 Tax=Lewinella sp. IMCC34183 TaxID=2248762 RepID=UPI000E268A7E|nr:ABC transporter substrate-binding protein [Lewinella sp. IMCC34183]
MTPLTLALDWTPNINHIGFYVAMAQGYYRDHDLEVTLADPAADGYATTPAKRVELGRADLALCPMESVISYRTKAEPFPLLAIAALLQEDLSAIAVRADSDIRSPRDLAGRSYASYRARYEDAIVQEMIRADGGDGDLQPAYPEKLGIWETLVNGTHDATWIFQNWEGVAAEGQGVELRTFALRDSAIPYGYSPVIAAGQPAVERDRDTYVAFLEATKRGYLFTEENPGEALSLLEPAIPAADRNINLKQALNRTRPYLGDPDTWGRMDADRVNAFLDWITARGLEPRRLRADEVYTNALLR